jgi:hypothetical protein
MEAVSSDPVLAKARVDFLLRHSGQRGVRQCKRHGRLAEMSFPEVLKALQEETGLGISRWWYAQMCDRLGVERSHRRARPAKRTLDEKRAQQRARYHRWAERAKADADGQAELRARWRASWQRRKERGYKRPPQVKRRPS